MRKATIIHRRSAMTNRYPIVLFLALLNFSHFALAAATATAAAATAAIPAAADGFDIIVLGGQSNAVGFGDGPWEDELNLPSVNTHLFQIGRANNGCEHLDPWDQSPPAIYPAKDVLDNWFMSPCQPLAGPIGQLGATNVAMSFARRYYENIGRQKNRDVLIVPAALGGSASFLWWDERCPSPGCGVDTGFYEKLHVAEPLRHAKGLLFDLIQRVLLATTLAPRNRVVALLWLQGESDLFCVSDSPRKFVNGNPCNQGGPLVLPQWSSAEWLIRTSAIFNEIHRETHSNFPILVGGMVRSFTGWGRAGARLKEQMIADATRTFQPGNSFVTNAVYVPPPAESRSTFEEFNLRPQLKKFANPKDPSQAVHFSNQSLQNYGRVMFEDYFSRIKSHAFVEF
ncbi:MAG: hypothetical protein C5B49_13640 [Bdellovibrio sp.]|nr:MAG: hypothetical protein C5B49_13640 [Bdellovibrio sp.]